MTEYQTLQIAKFKTRVLTEHLDGEGLVSKDSNPGRWSGGNQPLDTAVFYALLSLYDAIDSNDILRYQVSSDLLWVGKELGLMERNDGRPDQNSWDNYIGWSSAGLLMQCFGPPAAIERYGRSHCWFYQNEPGFKHWIASYMGRFPGFVGHIKLCAKKRPSCLDVELMSYRLNNSPRGRFASPAARIPKWLMALCYLDSEPRLYHESLAFIQQVRVDFDSPQNMFGAVYGTNHPFALAPTLDTLII